MTDAITTRLHIGGLTPQITPDHLRDRFRSFGTVTDVATVGPDALGQPRPFAYLTLETTPQQLRKCLNIMSGAMWRGTTLRLAEAKPTWNVRLEKERNRPAAEETKRLHKRIKRIAVMTGTKYAQDMRLVTPETAARQSQFWINDSGHLIRPLAVRPSHPIPLLSKPVPGSRPPARATRRVIDPRRWGSTHVLLTGSATAPEADGWSYVEADEDEELEDENGRTLLGWWRKAGEEDVEVRVRRAPEADDEDWEMQSDASDAGTDDGSDLFPIRGGRSDSPMFPVRAERADSPLFPTRGEQASSPLFPAREVEAEAGTEAEAEAEEDASSPLFPTRSVEAAVDPESPLFPTRELSAPASGDDASSASDEASSDDEAVSVTPEASEDPESVSIPSEEAPSPSPSASPEPVAAPASRPVPPTLAIPAQILQTATTERSTTLGVLASLLDEPVTATEKKNASEWAGFGEDSDDDGDYSALKPQVLEDDEYAMEVPRASAPSPETPRVRREDVEMQEPEAEVDAEVEAVEMPVVQLPQLQEGEGSDSASDSSSSGSSSASDSGSDAESSDKAEKKNDKAAEDGSDSDSSSSSDSKSNSGSDSDSDSSDSSDADSDGSDSGSGSGSDSSEDDKDGKDDKSEKKDDKKDEKKDGKDKAKAESSDDDDSDDSDDSDSDSDSDSSGSDSDSDSDSDSSDSSDSDSDSDSSDSSTPPTQQQTLKSLFATSAPRSLFALADEPDSAPVPSAGFSLGALAPDLELDADMDIALPNRPAPQLEFLAATTQSHWAADAGVPLFFPLARGAKRGEARSVLMPPAEEEGAEDGWGGDGGEGYGGADGYNAHAHAPAHGHVHTDRADRFAASSGANLVPVAAKKRDGFWRDGSDADMKARWEARRLELTRGWKRKHREAVKHRRRRGGDDAE